MKAIITGAAGFIGVNMARRLLEKGWRVTGSDNLSRRGAFLNLSTLERLNGDWKFIHMDVRNSGEVFRVLKDNADTDLVLHCAAQVAVTTSVLDPTLDFEVNARGTLNILEAMRVYCPGAFLIFPSTNKVYGESVAANVTELSTRYIFGEERAGISEEQPLDFHSPYGCSKGVADQYVHDYFRIYRVRTVVCRQSCIYGPHQLGVEDQGWVAWFLIAALLNLPVTIYGNGKQVRDLLYVDDLVDLFLTLFENRGLVAGRVYNVGGGPENSLSVNELIAMIPSLTGKTLSLHNSEWRPGDQKIFISDISKLRKDLGWKPKIDVRRGLERLVFWLQDNEEIISRAFNVV